MTSMQFYALFIHPLIALTILGIFAAFLMRQSKRDALRILAAEQAAHIAAPQRREAGDAMQGRKHFPAE